MIYRQYLPSPRLRPFVRLIWSLTEDADDDRGSDPFARGQRVVADGIVEAVFHFGHPFVMSIGDGDPEHQPRSSTVCQVRRWIDLEPGSGRVGFVAARFRPGGFHRFVPMPVSELADLAVDARDLWGLSAVARLEELLQLAKDDEERVGVVESFLLAQLRPSPYGSIDSLTREVWKHEGRLSMKQLRSASGLSERTLQRTFRTALGAPAKTYCRIVRFLSVCRRLRRGDWKSLTEVALEGGYYDQAHFIGESQSLAGVPPGELVARADIVFLEQELSGGGESVGSPHFE